MISPELLLFLVLGIFIYYIVNTHLKESYENKSDTIVYLFYAPWCSYSQNFLTIWEALMKNKMDFPSDVQFIKVNIDLNPDKAKQYNIKQVPKVIVVKSPENIIKVPTSELTSYDKFYNSLVKMVSN